MTREDVVEAVKAIRGDAVLVMGPGKSTTVMWRSQPHPASIYNMELAYASPFALGIAWGAPEERVISFEGDGSMFAAIPTLGTIARRAPANLTVIVLANGVWGTSDGSVEITVGPEKFPELARACGWDARKVRFASDLAELGDALRDTLAEPGPWFVVAQAERSSADASVLPDGSLRAREPAPLDLIETVDATRRWLSQRRDAR
jgi:thiamine pyrophosphate-dependent acetolactate synthase large subunit-like protein